MCIRDRTSSRWCRYASRGARDTPKDARSPILSLQTRPHASPARPGREPSRSEARDVRFFFASKASGTNNLLSGSSQTLLDRNKALIYEINKNHEARVAGGMERNVDLLRELNANVAKAQELYEEAGGGFEFRVAEEGRSDEAERRA